MSYEWLRQRKRNDYSQGGEDGILQAIFEVIGTANQWCLECGAADGLLFSNTRRLIERGWNSIQVEADPGTFARLVDNSVGLPRVQCANVRLDNDHRLDAILEAAKAPLDLDLMVIDIDGQDFHAWNALLKYQPRVVLIEFDPNVDDEFVPTIGGEGQAGRMAIHRLANGKLYTPVYQNLFNTIAVRQPLDRLLISAPEIVA